MFDPRKFGSTAALVAALVAGATGPVAAHEIKIGKLVIHHPWLRQPVGASDTAAGFTTIDNTGDQDDTLLKVTIENIPTVQIHEMKMEGDVMKMGEMAGGLLIPAHKSAVLKPKSDHLMLIGIKGGLMEGTQLKGSFTFAKAGTVSVDFEVAAPNADMSDMKMK